MASLIACIHQVVSAYLVICTMVGFGCCLRDQDVADTLPNKDVQTIRNNNSNSCPLSPCHCDAVTKQVICSGLKLTSVPTGLPTDLKFLHLENNQITFIGQDHLRDFTQVEFINVSNNYIEDISPKAFVHNPSLHNLDLSGNHLGGESALIFLCVSSSLRTLNLSSNNFHQENFNLLTLCRMHELELLDLSGNNISGLPVSFLNVFPRLKTFILQNNSLTEMPEDLSAVTHSLEYLSLAKNRISTINCSALENLSDIQGLDLGYNNIVYLPDGMCSDYLQKLTHLVLSGNLFKTIGPGAFRNFSSLTSLHMSDLPNISYLTKRAFTGLANLRDLDLSNSRELEFIHAEAFSNSRLLESLNVSNCGFSWLHEDVLLNLTYLRSLYLQGNPWHCDCDLKWLPTRLSQLLNQSSDILPQSIICASPLNLAGYDLMNSSVLPVLECHGPIIINSNVTLWFGIGSQAVLDCETVNTPRAKVTWTTSKQQTLEYHPAYPELSNIELSEDIYHDTHIWHDDTDKYHHDLQYSNRLVVLRNGSLLIDYVTRQDAGNYTCMVDNGFGNHSVVVTVRLNSRIFKWLTICSMIWGFVCAFSFFLVAVVFATIRYLFYKCNSKERKKRKSIREVLNSLHDFKTVQIDRFCAYKTAKINRLATFKDEKVQKLVAFKTAKVDKLRNYKQVTMASIFHHLEKMQQHYQGQMNKVKDNCSQQVEKLRENYASHVGKFKYYRSEKMERIRDNYTCQVLKIKEYRSGQMNKIRDQYKLQQQHLLKLMELLEIGNCLNVVEAECMRTESMLFDPNISFDLEAQPVHVQRDLDFTDDESEYMTAGSQSDPCEKVDAIPDVVVHDASASAPNPDAPGQKKPSHKSFAAKAVQPKNRKTKHHRKKTKSKDHHIHPLGHHRDSSTSSNSSTEQTVKMFSPSQDTIIAPPPTFSCEILDLNLPLEDILASHHVGSMFHCDVDMDNISMYQTPPSSAHQDIESGRPNASCSQARNGVNTECESVQVLTTVHVLPEPKISVVCKATSDSCDEMDTSRNDKEKSFNKYETVV